MQYATVRDAIRDHQDRVARRVKIVSFRGKTRRIRDTYATLRDTSRKIHVSRSGRKSTVLSITFYPIDKFLSMSGGLVDLSELYLPHTDNYSFIVVFGVVWAYQRH